jgi:RTX calcium-binding nonapeptide repeat (4 copies)
MVRHIHKNTHVTWPAVGRNTMRGSQGDDVLAGGDGADTLYRGAGKGRFTIKSIAVYARKSGVTRRFHCRNRPKNPKNQPSRCRLGRSNTRNAHARYARLTGYQGLGRRVEGAWAVHHVVGASA